MTVVWVVLAGAIGAVTRFAVSEAIQSVSKPRYPLGTLFVNLTGSFAIGWIAAGGEPKSTAALAGIGFLGGFTTFSTWMIETLRLEVTGMRAAAVLNVAVSTLAGIGLAAVGHALAS